MSDATKVLQTGTGAADASQYPTPVTIIDASGNPVELGGGEETPVTSDSITDATTVGKNLLKAKDAATARTAIGAGTSSFSGAYNDLTGKPTIPAAYTLPAASTTALGGVKKGAAVPDLATGADGAAIVAKVNALLAQLRAAGVITV